MLRPSGLASSRCIILSGARDGDVPHDAPGGTKVRHCQRPAQDAECPEAKPQGSAAEPDEED